MEVHPAVTPLEAGSTPMDADGPAEQRGRTTRRRWGAIPSKDTPVEDTSKPDADTQPAKRKRRSRWEDPPPEAAVNEERALMLMPDEIVLSNGIKVIMPAALTGRGDPEVVAAHKALVDIERQIRSGVIDLPPENRRSPSPPPIYDSMGIRLNTREVRAKDKLMRERQRLIEVLIRLDPVYRPPADYKPEKKWRKIVIPEKEFPGYNFIGLIIGPRGNTQKRMQSETNTKIAIRGRGSVKQGAAKSDKYDYGEDEELHVLITGDRDEDVEAAKAMVDRLLQPMDEEMNEHKQKQLRELAALNGTLKEDTNCLLCGEPGHTQMFCPKKALDVYRLPDAMQSRVEEQYARDVARMNPGESGSADAEYKSFLAELGGTDPRAAAAGGAGMGGGYGGGFGRDSAPEGAKLWIGNLSPTINDMALRQLFEPFGAVTWASVKFDNGVSRGYGFIHFAEEDQAKAALEGLNGKVIDGRPLTVRARTAPGEAPQRGPRPGLGAGRPDDDLPAECKLFVGGIPPHVDEFTLRREFERFGALVYCRLITDRETQRPKGYGFVAFTDPACAAAAIQGLDRYPGFDAGRPMSVRQAGDRSGGPGGGGAPRPGGGFGGYGPPPRGPPPPGPYGGQYGAVPPPLPPPDGGYGFMPPPPQYGGYDPQQQQQQYGGYPPAPPGPPGGGYDAYGGYSHMDPAAAAYAAQYSEYYGAAPAAGDPYAGYQPQYGVAPPLPSEGAPPPPSGEQEAPPPPPPDASGAQQAGGYGAYGAEYYGQYQAQPYDAGGSAVAGGVPPPPGPPPPPPPSGDALPPPPPGGDAVAPLESEYERFLKETTT